MSKLTTKGSKGKFKVTPKGIYYLQAKPDRWIKLSNPIRVVGAVPTGGPGQKAGRVLEFVDEAGSTRRFFVHSSAFLNQSSLTTLLADQGVRVTLNRDRRRLLTRFLTKAKSASLIEFVRRPGWHEKQRDGTSTWMYVTPRETIKRKDAPGTIELLEPFENGPDQKGSLKDWNGTIGVLCARNVYLVLIVSAAFAAILLRRRDHESIALHFVGPSSTGKTTGLHVGCSVVGSPDYLGSWEATDNGLEAIATQRNDGLLALDELAQMPPKDAAKLAYRLLNGNPKARTTSAGSLAQGEDWRIVLLSSGEIGLVEHLAEARIKATIGQQVRMLELPVNRKFGMFDELHDHDDPAGLAKALRERASQCYGTPAREFIRSIVKRPKACLGHVKLSSDQFERDFLKAIPEARTDGPISRVIGHFAAVASAGELAIHLKVVAWEPGAAQAAAKTAFEEWLSSYRARTPMSSAEAVKIVCKTIQERAKGEFLPLNAANLALEDQPIGFTFKFKDEHHVYVFEPTEFERLFCERIPLPTLLSALKVKGLLETGSRETPTKQIRVPGNKASDPGVCFYVIKRKVLKRYLTEEGGDE
jgi:hypothetical protein